MASAKTCDDFAGSSDCRRRSASFENIVGLGDAPETDRDILQRRVVLLGGIGCGRIVLDSHEKVQGALREALATLRQVRKPAGILATNIDDVCRYRDWSYQFVAACVDLGLFVKGADLLAKICHYSFVHIEA